MFTREFQFWEKESKSKYWGIQLTGLKLARIPMTWLIKMAGLLKLPKFENELLWML